MTSAGLADLTERQAEAVAALDRALEARLGELDRAFATRQTHLEGAHLEAEGELAEIIEDGVSEFKRAASGERRLLHEESASALAKLEDAVNGHRRELEEAAAAQLSEMRRLIDQVHELEQAAAARIRALEEQVGEHPGPSER